MSLQVSWEQFRLTLSCPELTHQELQHRCIIFLPAYCLSDFGLSVGEWVQLVPDQGNHAIQPIACQVHPEYAQLSGKPLYTRDRKSSINQRYNNDTTDKHEHDDDDGDDNDEDADIKISTPLAAYLAWSLVLGRKNAAKGWRPEDLSWSVRRQNCVQEVAEVILDPVCVGEYEDTLSPLDSNVNASVLKSSFPLSRQITAWNSCEGNSMVLHSGSPYLLRALRYSQEGGAANKTDDCAIAFTRRTRITILGMGKSDIHLVQSKKRLCPMPQPIISSPSRKDLIANCKIANPLKELPLLFQSWFEKAESSHKGRQEEIVALIRRIAHSLSFDAMSKIEANVQAKSEVNCVREGISPAMRLVHRRQALNSLCPSSVFLIEGPTGSGKTHLARTLAETSPFPHVFLAAAELFKSYQGETEATLRNVFARAASAASQRPSSILQSIPKSNDELQISQHWFANAAIIVIDDIDTLTPTRGSSITGSSTSAISSPGSGNTIASPAEMADAGEEGTSAGRNIRLENRIIDTLGELIDAVQHPPLIEQTWRVPGHLVAGSSSHAKDSQQNVDASVHLRPRVIVIATTSRIHAVHPQLLRSDRFAFSPPITTSAKNNCALIGSLLKLGPLQLKSRMELLSHLLQVSPADDTDTERLILRVAEKMHGYVVSDVIHLVTEAYMGALRRMNSSELHRHEYNNGLLDIIEELDFSHAFAKLGAPSALRSSGLMLNLQQYVDLDEQAQSCQGGTPTNISSAFNHLGGRKEVIEVLHRDVVWPLTSQRKWKASIASVSSKSKLGTPTSIAISPVSGILIFGSPGSGKTALAIALAKATSLPVLSIAATSIISKVHGGSEAALDRVFSLAKASSPCLLLLDQLEAICSKESADGSGAPSKLLASFISQLDSLQRERDTMNRTKMDSESKDLNGIDEGSGFVQNTVIVVGTTNYARRLDRSLFMPGRIETQIKLDDLNQPKRYEILVKCTQKVPVRCDALGVEERVIDETLHRKLFNETFLREVSEDKWTAGWSPADIKALTSEAAMDALREVRMASLGSKGKASATITSELFVFERHFRAALERMAKRKNPSQIVF